MSPEKLWTVRDVADYCRVSPETVRSWAKSGRLPKSRRIGKRLLWDEKALLAALRKSTKGSER